MKTQPVVLLAAAPGHPLAGVLAEPFAVVQASTGAEVLELTQDHDPDVVLLEHELPDMSGFEACLRLRSDRRLPFNVPCLILTEERPTPTQRVEAVRAGVWDFVHYPADRDALPLRLEGFVQAKRNLDLALSDGLTDPRTGLHTRNGLARRARQLGALMARERGGLACIVFVIDGNAHNPEVGGVVAHAARVSDVVGTLSDREVAVLAPGTDHAGVVRLARRMANALREGVGNGAASAPVKSAGYEAVTNLSYTPIDPVELLHRAAIAVHSGLPEPELAWLKRYESRVPSQGAH